VKAGGTYRRWKSAPYRQRHRGQHNRTIKGRIEQAGPEKLAVVGSNGRAGATGDQLQVIKHGSRDTRKESHGRRRLAKLRMVTTQRSREMARSILEKFKIRLFFSSSIVSLAPEGRVKRREPEEGREAIIPVYRHYPKSV
jgi:hypothetical protein